MRRRLFNATSVTLSAVIIATSLSGFGYQAAMAETSVTPEVIDSKPKKQRQKLSQTAQPKAFPAAAPKANKNSTPPAPIEPFIRADAVALGQWLVLKTVKNLVAPAATSAPEVTSKTKPESSPAQTPAATTAQQQPAAPAAPKVAVQALPPEPSSNPTIDSYTEMRVALTKQAANVVVAASQGGVLTSTNGDLIESLSAGVGYQISANNQGLFINGQPAPTAVWLESDNGYVAVGDRWYRGRLLLLWQNGGVMAVNYVLLQEYLYSVVGAEMSASWSLEALKAQAVAARSYAIVHTVRHQRRAYDLDDTQRYQAYKGIATEASSTQQAVQETSGEFISYGGGVVESLYAANQGIVDDAHSGYGMSQTGALDLAEQGYRYYEILSAYYPDTSVGRIDIGE
ncbi:MAG: SpoIID/LytB domain-containing protein [Cyanobacteria bacterium P01_H01_bin.105]